MIVVNIFWGYNESRGFGLRGTAVFAVVVVIIASLFFFGAVSGGKSCREIWNRGEAGGCKLLIRTNSGDRVFFLCSVS